MPTSDTPLAKQRPPGEYKTRLEVLQLKKDEALRLCSQLGIKPPPGAGSPVLHDLLLTRLHDQIERPKPPPDQQASTGAVATERMLERIEVLVTAFTDVQSQLTAQALSFTDREKASEEKFSRLTEKIAELEQKLASGSNNGGVAPVTVETAVKAAVDAVTEVSDVEKRKLNLRLTRLPAAVDSQADAEKLVDELLSTLDVKATVDRVTFFPLKASYASVTAGKTPAADKTGSVLVCVADAQGRDRILKARGKLRTSDRLSKMGVNEDLTRKQQAAKSAAWPAFMAARQQKRRTFWQAETLFVDGMAHHPPPPSPSLTTITNPTVSSSTPSPVSPRTSH